MVMYGLAHSRLSLLMVRGVIWWMITHFFENSQGFVVNPEVPSVHNFLTPRLQSIFNYSCSTGTVGVTVLTSSEL